MIEKPTLSIVFLGRVDSGKSTLAGRLLHSLGTVNDSIIERLQVESREFGFAKTHYANVLSRTREETRRGRSIHLAYSRAETKHFHINIIDAPAAPFVKSMIRGISQANVGIIVLDAESGSLEQQTVKEILLTTQSLGEFQLIFCVNKMDSMFVANSETKFKEIQNSEMSKIYKMHGYKGDPLLIPVSAWTGDNVVDCCDMKWYKGPTLLDAINSLKIPTYLEDKPLRIPISKVYNKRGKPIVFGKIESGILKLDSKLRCTPNKKVPQVTIESIEIFRERVSEAKAGQFVTIKLQNVRRSDVKSGMVLSDSRNDPAREVLCFKAEIIVLKRTAIKIGYKPTLHCHSLQTRCQFIQFYECSKMPLKTERKENPSELRRGQVARVLLKPDNPISLETLQNIPKLGKFIMRDNGCVCVVGIVKDITFVDEHIC